MTNHNTGANTRLQIVIDGWSSEADREALAVADEEKGPSGVVKLLHDSSRVGYLSVGSRVGQDITFARQIVHNDGSRRIAIVIARHPGLGEVINASPTTDYPFTLIELHLDPGGEGDGTMSVGVKVTIHKHDDQIDLEKFGAGTIVLNDVRTVS